MKSSGIKHPSEGKEYRRPSITIVLLDGNDVVATSDDPDGPIDEITPETTDTSSKSRQRDYIFDDL